MFGEGISVPPLQVIGDGTFAMVPLIFEQLFTLHAIIDHIAIPVMFILSVNRITQMYECVFRHMKSSLGFHPTLFMVDYEKGQPKGHEKSIP